MAEDADTTIAFKVTADGVKEASAGLDSVGAALERQRQAVKQMDAAVAQSDFASRLAGYRAEADKLNATQAQTAVELAKVSAASGKASADIAAQGQAIKDSATRFADFGGAVSSAFDGLAPGVKKFQDSLTPALKSVDGLIAREQQLAGLQPPAAIVPPAVQSSAATTASAPLPVQAPVAQPQTAAILTPVADKTALQQGIAEHQAALQKIRDGQAEYAAQQKADEDAARKLRYAQDISAALDSLEQIRAKYAEAEASRVALDKSATADATSDLVARSSGAIDQVQKRIGELGSANAEAARAFGTGEGTALADVQKQAEAAKQAVEGLAASEKQLGQVQPAALPPPTSTPQVNAPALAAPATPAAAPTTAPPPLIQQIIPTVDKAALDQATAEQLAAIEQIRAAQATATTEQNADVIAQTSATLSDIQKQFNAVQLQETATVHVNLDSQREATEQEIDALVATIKAKLTSITGGGSEIAQEFTAGIKDGLEAGLKEVDGVDQKIASGFSGGLAEGIEQGIREAIAEHGFDAVAKQFSVSVGDMQKEFDGLKLDKTATVKVGIDPASLSASDKQLADQTTNASKQYAAMEATNTAAAKTELAQRSTDFSDSIAAMLEDAKAKFEALELDKTSIVQAGLEDQQTEIEKSLADEVEAIKKKFEGVNIGKLLGNSDAAVASVAALGNEIDQVSRKLTALKAMNDAAAQSGFLSRMAEYRVEAAALNAQQDLTASSFQRATQAINENGSAFELNTSEIKKKGREGAEVIARLSEAFREVAPAIQEYSGAIDIGLRSMSGFLGLLQGGPGIAIGGVIAAVGILGAVMGSAKKEADELAKSTTDNKEALASYLEEIDKRSGSTSTKTIDDKSEQRSVVTTHQVKVTGEEDLQKALDHATASIAQYDTEITLLEKKIADNEEQMKLDVGMSWDELKQRSAIVVPQLKNENEGYEEQIGLLKQRKEVASEYAAAEKQNAADKKALEDALAHAGATGGKANTVDKTLDFNAPDQLPTSNKPRPDDASATQKRLDENLAAIQKLRTIQADYQDKQTTDALAADKLQASNQIETAQEAIEAIKQKYAAFDNDRKALVKVDLDDQRMQMEQEIGDAIDAIHAKDLEQTNQVEQMRREAWQQSHDLFKQLEEDKAQQVQLNIQKEKTDRSQVTQSLMALGTIAAQLTAKQLEEAVKGHKIQGALILESIGDAMVAEGVRAMFQGGAQLLMSNFASGGGLLALGAAEVGVGLGLGAAGSAAQPPTASGGTTPTATPAPASGPIRDNTQQTSNDSDKGPTVIYINMPTVVSPSPEDGLRVRQAFDAASRVYGAPV